jgi:hypothetical protein
MIAPTNAGLPGPEASAMEIDTYASGDGREGVG